MKNWCVCGHHRDEHDGHGRACYATTDAAKQVFCYCMSYVEDEADNLLTQGALYDP